MDVYSSSLALFYGYEVSNRLLETIPYQIIATLTVSLAFGIKVLMSFSQFQPFRTPHTPHADDDNTTKPMDAYGTLVVHVFMVIMANVTIKAILNQNQDNLREDYNGAILIAAILFVMVFIKKGLGHLLGILKMDEWDVAKPADSPV